MLHAKTLAIDGAWATIGSVNIDNRSFGLNHEGSLAVYDAGVARRLEAIFAEDLRFAEEVAAGSEYALSRAPGAASGQAVEVNDL